MSGCHVQPEQMFNLVFGYAGQILEADYVTTSNGTTSVLSTAVPPDEIHIVTQITVYHNDTVARTIRLLLEEGGGDCVLARVDGVDNLVTVDRQGWWVLVEGDQIEGRAISLASGKRVYLTISGYKMILSQ